ncbi:adenylyl-sulfate kinase [Nakamurella sp. PAMC28650]|nr:adenylyl-sulfate kinase [Nakamurella sp. PAMC28650]
MWVAHVTGMTLWLTGLPSAGKTTLAFGLAERLVAAGVDVEVLDGDEVRTHLSAGLGFSRADRDTHVDRIGFVAELLASHGVVVIVPVIAPYSEARKKVRAHHRDAGTGFALVHVSTALEVCAVRDVKGLYARAFRGEITSMTGVDDPYEVPRTPELRIDTAVVGQAAAVGRLLDLLAGFGVAVSQASASDAAVSGSAPSGVVVNEGAWR